MHIMCIILCLLSALSRKVGALQISVISIISISHHLCTNKCVMSQKQSKIHHLCADISVCNVIETEQDSSSVYSYV